MKNLSTSTHEPKTLSTFQAALRLGVSVGTIQNWVERGSLKAWKTPGGHRRIIAEDLENFAALKRHDKSQQQNCRCLVLTQDPNISEELANQLTSDTLSVEIHIADDPLALLLMIGKFTPDMVILDSETRGLSSDVIETLRAQQIVTAPDLCVVKASDSELNVRLNTHLKGIPILSRPLDMHFLRCLATRAIDPDRKQWTLTSRRN